MVDPVNVQQPFREEPRAVDLHERVVVTERRDHETALIAYDGHVMRQAVGLAGRSLVRQGQDGALPDEVRGGVVLVQSANTGPSASRERSFWEGVGSLAFMYTTKWASVVKSAI